MKRAEASISGPVPDLKELFYNPPSGCLRRVFVVIADHLAAYAGANGPWRCPRPRLGSGGFGVLPVRFGNPPLIEGYAAKFYEYC